MSLFDYSQDFSRLDFRQNPELYRVGIGEQGVLMVEPYKSELLALWKFKTPAMARESSRALLKKFAKFSRECDFAGMDMTRKFLQMGYTRSRRYANHRSGKKYLGPVPADKRGKSGSHGRPTLPLEIDPVKAKSAEIFYQAWQKVEANAKYRKMRKEWKTWYG
jgi:hypothetical protein